MPWKPEAGRRRTPHVITARSLMTAATIMLTLPLVACMRHAAPQQQPRSQNPSPMVGPTRAHERIPEVAIPGLRLVLEDLLPQAVPVFVPAGVDLSVSATLLVHFHGAVHIPEHAVSMADRPYIAAVVNLGAGSGVYERAFSDPATFPALIAGVRERLQAEMGSDVVLERIVVSAFSAGHGAVRALLRAPAGPDGIHGALLLDGIHTGYVPAGTVLHEGGRLDPDGLAPYLELLHAAVAGDKAVLITHSDVFPGTFASTTETVTWLLDQMALRRQPVLAWGPGGMQQVAEAAAGRLLVLGFAGNAAPDHMDHLHGMPTFLRRLDNL